MIFGDKSLDNTFDHTNFSLLFLRLVLEKTIMQSFLNISVLKRIYKPLILVLSRSALASNIHSYNPVG